VRVDAAELDIEQGSRVLSRDGGAAYATAF